jgi:parallel beta-helix repeat protein
VSAPRLRAAAIFFASLLAVVLAAQAHAAPLHEQRSPSCTSVVSPGGGLQRFVDRLRPGSVGCLAPGKYAAHRLVLRVSGTAAARITLTSLNPSKPAEISGLLWLMDSANNWTISHLRLDGRNSRNLPSPQVNGDDSVWLDDDVTNYQAAGPSSGGGICFALGNIDTWGYAANTTIARSRIHDCGVSDNANHGIYVAATTGSTIIRNNWIFRNGDRGIQLYPDAKHVLIANNVIDANGSGVIFSGLGSRTSSDITVTRNIISNSRNRWNVESWYPAGTPPGSGNLVTANCLWASGANQVYRVNGGLGPSVGFTVADTNVIQKPLFRAENLGDLRLRSDSGCKGFGPIQGRLPLGSRG